MTFNGLFIFFPEGFINRLLNREMDTGLGKLIHLLFGKTIYIIFDGFLSMSNIYHNKLMLLMGLRGLTPIITMALLCFCFTARTSRTYNTLSSVVKQ